MIQPAPYLSDLNKVREWVASNPCPDPYEDSSACRNWLVSYWYMDECVLELPPGKARSFLDWLDIMAADRPHPVSEICIRYLAWEQPRFEI